ncbi:MAG: (E)-4-hydroxy-3-methylbut-2-enyl-diphosphate synthase [Cytophagales bacterium]|nr:(E)-4-hydroxy-3-methylbut-2-enyl-diphosphate synthase [Cytophagales bacterium]
MDHKRRLTREVKIGNAPLGGDQPIRIQSMTTVDTMDTEGSVKQTLKMVESGCEYVRLTAPSIKEAQNLQSIQEQLRSQGCEVPLIADIHFTPNAAELAARIVDKVRVNPGNYADKKKFEEIEYTYEAYRAELDRIGEKFSPLIEICKTEGTAIRIGTNHGSLSDRIMSRYGDTPLGMVESALEFIRICEEMNYFDIVISMKSSNPQVMIQAYRLLVVKLDEEGLQSYPLHLGVTEAGEAEAGRIKSALGIGTLLEEGLGDTVRVSLTEEPEVEAPVAKLLVDRRKTSFDGLTKERRTLKEIENNPVNPFEYTRRSTMEVGNFGNENVPRVVADFSSIEIFDKKDLKAIGHSYLSELDKWGMNDMGADYIYSGSKPIPFILPNGLKEIMDYEIWKTVGDQENTFPLLSIEELSNEAQLHPVLNFVSAEADNLDQVKKIDSFNNVVLILETKNEYALASLRRFFVELINHEVMTPVIVKRAYENVNEEQVMLYGATDIGGLLIDGLGDGAMISTQDLNSLKFHNETLFGILQAARTRITKTEYISCPSCGRTLFDLQETTAMIRKRTEHLKGVKIGVMGCIVNGPGEMADADFGYVGSGNGKITLYKGREVMKRGVPAEHALDELIDIIKENDRWVEP